VVGEGGGFIHGDLKFESYSKYYVPLLHLRQMKIRDEGYTQVLSSLLLCTLVISILLHCLVYWQHKNCTCNTVDFVGSFL